MMAACSRSTARRCAGLALVLVALGNAGTAQARLEDPSGPGRHHGFTENRGQWDPEAAFRGTFGPMTVWLTSDGWVLGIEERAGISSGPRRTNGEAGLPVGSARAVAVRMRFPGGGAVTLAGEERRPSRHNWFLGDDPGRWVTDVPSFGRVRLSNLGEGLSAIAREHSGRFEYDIVVEPGRAVADVVIECEGQDALEVDRSGELLMRTPYGSLRHTPPVAWEETDAGDRRPVSCRWRILDRERVGFLADGRDPDRRLVIDPGVIWSAVIGGLADEDPGIGAIASSANGNLNVAGVVVSTTFPATPGAYQPALAGGSGWDAWVARFNPAGLLLWCTYFGGTALETGRGIAVGPGDRLTIVGGTASSNLPLVGAFDPTFNGNAWDGFLATFDPSQSGAAQLTWSTFLGGAGDDRLNSVAVDGAGIVTAAGWTFSPTISGVLPANAYKATLQGVQDGLIARFDPALGANAQLLWFTFLGASGFDYLGPVALGSGGRVVVQGATTSTNYPVANAAQPLHGGGVWDTVVSILDPALPPASQLAYSTYLGGSANDTENGLAVDAAGLITVGGWTNSADFPVTPGAHDISWNGGFDAFVARLDPLMPPAAQLAASTYVGGSLDEGVNDLVLDASGSVRAVGSVNSPNFPTTAGSYQPAFQGGPPTGYGPYDAFAFHLDPALASLTYATYIGGTMGYDFAYGAVADPCGNVFISGITRSADFPASSGSYSALDDTFVMLMDLLPAGCSRFGTTTAGCLGPLAIDVTAIPMNGNAAFGVTCSGGSPGPTGYLGISTVRYTTPLLVSGFSLWIDPAFALLVLASGGPGGHCVVPLPLPAGQLMGFTAHAQFAWADPCAPGGVSGSCGLTLVVQ